MTDQDPADGTMWRPVVYRDACVGSGLCAATAPAYFRLVDDRSIPVQELFPPNNVLLDAAACCPGGAIEVYDARTGALIDPDQ